MFEAIHESYRAVDRYLREHTIAYAGTLLVVTALAWTLTGMALGDTPGSAVVEGIAFGVTFAALTLIGRRVLDRDG